MPPECYLCTLYQPRYKLQFRGVTHDFCILGLYVSKYVYVYYIAVVFPQDLLEKGLAANNFAMLGLGDIVIPGIFIALLLRFDVRYDILTNEYPFLA